MEEQIGASWPPAAAELCPEAVMAALGGVFDPELGSDIVDLGMVRSVRIDGGNVEVAIALTIAGCPLRNQIRHDVEVHVGGIPGVEHVEVRTGEMSREERASLMARARFKARERAVRTDIPPSARVLAMMSGKGGVGKSSITVNLAAALARLGFAVGILDADVWGFSVPRMLGIQGELRVRDRKIVPIDHPIGDGFVRVVSMGFLASEDSAIMWRGLTLNRAVQHFLEDVTWGEVDYLLIDMPPGTGDVQMGLARMLPRTEAIIVTTPSLTAQRIAGRAADMARKGYLRIAGVIENMSAFTCDHGESYALFGSGGGQSLASQLGVPLIGTVPLRSGVAAPGDGGTPVPLGDGPLADVFTALAERLVREIAPPLRDSGVDMTGCTARLLERIEDSLRS